MSDLADLSTLTLDDIELPYGWELLAGADAGTYLSCVFVAISPKPYEAFAIAEFPNYRYVAGEIELLGESIGEWADRVTTAWDKLSKRKCKPLIDWNSQFVSEFKHQNIFAIRNRIGIEVRTEITREYFQHRRIHLAPWLDVLPYELEEAQWPADVSHTTGRLARIKDKDHTLDCVEHVLSRRPRSKRLTSKDRKQTFLEQQFARHAGTLKRSGVDRHLGAN